MIFETGEISVSASTWNTALYNFIHRFDERITLDDGKLTFDNKFKVDFSNSSRPKISLICNDETTISLTSMGYWPSSPICISTLIITETMFCFFGKRKNYTEGSFTLLWLKNQSRDFFGAIGGESHGYCSDINLISSLYDANDSTKGTYSIGKVANFNVISPQIIYANTFLLVNSIGDIAFINNLVNSSNTPISSTITIDGKNYFVIGTNTLLPIT